MNSRHDSCGRSCGRSRLLRRTWLPAVGVFALSVAWASTARAQTPAYTVTDLGGSATGGGFFEAEALGINKQGQVVGDIGGVAFRWDAAVGLTTGVLGPSANENGSSASAINSSGQIAGASSVQFSVDLDGGLDFAVIQATHAFRLDTSGLLDLQTLGPEYYYSGYNTGSPSYGRQGANSYSLGINDAGQVVGASTVSISYNTHAFVYSDVPLYGAQLQDLGTLPAPAGADYSVGNAINNHGQVVGNSQTYGVDSSPANSRQHATLWTLASGAPSLVDLGTLPGLSWSQANGLNDLGQVVGDSSDDSGASDFAFLWDSVHGMQNLGVPAGKTSSYAQAINANGQVVGEAYTYDPNLGDAGDDRAVLWDAQNVPRDLNTLIPAGSGWTLKWANAINDNGEIVGSGLLNGQAHAFLLKPVTSATPTGSTIAVSPTTDTTLTFSSVTSGGTTTISTATNPPSMPAAYQGIAVAVDIQTTAAFSGPVIVCVSYDPTQFADPSAVRLLHYTNGAWQDITTSVNTANHLVCGQTSSFSPFQLAKKLPTVPVRIDVKPGSTVNSINLGSNGATPVVIFSSPTFDARTLDPLSVTLASAPVKLTGKGTAVTSVQDVDGDGLPDLVVQIQTSALQLSMTATTATLEGRTLDGKTHVVGSDTVRVVQ